MGNVYIVTVFGLKRDDLNRIGHPKDIIVCYFCDSSLNISLIRKVNKFPTSVNRRLCIDPDGIKPEIEKKNQPLAFFRIFLPSTEPFVVSKQA